MTIKQKVMKLAYPLIAVVSPKKTLGNTMDHKPAPTDFYSLSAIDNQGKPFSFEALRHKHVLMVNTASFCGYTGQYDSLQQLHETYGDRLAVVGFPSNDFGGQEPNSDAEIEGFCRINYGVTFPLMQKAPVTGANCQPVYQWLTDAEHNGWNNQAPDWNFCKYLISPDGQLLHYFNSGIDPMGAAITKYLQ